MNRARLAVILAASLAAMGAAWLAGGFGSGKSASVAKAPAKEIMVAARDLEAGALLGADAVKWVKWPADNITPAMLTRESPAEALKNIETGRARQPIFAGEPILQQKVMAANDQNLLASMLGKGRRAVTVPLNAESGVGGFIMPDDRVDVLLIRKVKDKSIAQTVLTNVRVLAMDQSTIVKPDDKAKSGKPAKTATLELEPEQAEAIAAASSLGKLTLSLRALAENANEAADTAPQLNTNFAGRSIGMLRYGVKSIIQLGP